MNSVPRTAGCQEARAAAQHSGERGLHRAHISQAAKYSREQYLQRSPSKTERTSQNVCPFLDYSHEPPLLVSAVLICRASNFITDLASSVSSGSLRVPSENRLRVPKGPRWETCLLC